MKIDNFFAELKRRNVYKVAFAYAVVAMVAGSVATQVFPFSKSRTGRLRLVVLATVIGFPIALLRICYPVWTRFARFGVVITLAGKEDVGALTSDYAIRGTLRYNIRDRARPLLSTSSCYLKLLDQRAERPETTGFAQRSAEKIAHATVLIRFSLTLRLVARWIYEPDKKST